MVYRWWWAEHRTKDIPVTDREGFLVAALTAVGLTPVDRSAAKARTAPSPSPIGLLQRRSSESRCRVAPAHPLCLAAPASQLICGYPRARRRCTRGAR